MSKLRGRVHQIRNRILRLHKEYPEIALSYQVLLFKYWAEYDSEIFNIDHVSGIYFIEGREVSGLSNSLTIGRAFRSLVAEGLIVVPEDAQDKRDLLEGEYVQVFGGGRV